MLKFFNRLFPKDIELRLKGHERWIHDVQAHSDGDWVFTAGWDRTVRMFSLSTGKCLRKFEGHQNTVWKVAILDQDTLLSTSEDRTARIWRISDGALLQKMEFEDNAWPCVKLDDKRFAVGTNSGKTHIFERDVNKEATLVHSFIAHERGINDFSVWQNRLATASLDHTAKVWDLFTFECLATLTGHEDSVRCVAMSESYVATGSWDGTIRVYDPESHLMIRTIATHRKYIRCVHLVGPAANVFSSSDDGTTRLFDTSNGDLLWMKKFKAHAVSSTVLKEGRIATALSSGEIVVYRTPPHIAPHMKALECYSFAGKAKKQPLHDAMVSSISGHSSPFDHCENLIKYEMCSVSYEEWRSAHRILMLAVEDGDINRDSHYNGEQSWWYDQLYLAIRDIQLRSREEYVSVKKYLSEAKHFGVIESTDAVLTALHVTKELKETARALQRAGILVLERILRMEDRLERLRETYLRYMNSQRKSQLVGIALQIIPIAGGAVAGALSAGTEIVKGLSVKDITDYALGLGSSIAENQVEGVSDRILRQAADTLSPMAIDSMNLARRGKLEEALRFCGLNIEMLQELFLEPLNDNLSITALGDMKMKGDEGGEDANIYKEEPNPTVTLMAENGNGGPAMAEKKNIDISEGRNLKASQKNYPTGGKQNEASSGHDESQGAESIKEVNGNDIGMAGRGISELKGVQTDPRSVRHFSQEEIATVWAAYICRYDDQQRDRHALLRDCLLRALKANEVFGTELVDRRLISVEEITSIALEGVENSSIELTLGLRARLKRFLLDSSSKDMTNSQSR